MTRLWSPDRAWFEARLEGFGASEAGALLGVSPWGSAREVVEAKARRTIPDPDAPERLRLRLGRDMEPMLLEHLFETLEERDGTGNVPRPRRPSPDRIFRQADRPHVYAHVDGFVGDAMVELKTDEYSSLPWGDEEGDPARVVPPSYYAQVQHGLAATARPRCYLFVQLGLHAQLLYVIPRNEQYIADLLSIEDALWGQVLEARDLLARAPHASIEHLLPALEGEELTEHLRQAHPRSTETIRQATPEQELLVEQLRLARLAKKAAEAQEVLAAAAVQNIIRDAAGLSSPLGTITWRTSAEGSSTSWELVAAAYRTQLRQVREELRAEVASGGRSPVELALLEEDKLEALVSLYTSKTPGSRRFLLPTTWK